MYLSECGSLGTKDTVQTAGDDPKKSSYVYNKQPHTLSNRGATNAMPIQTLSQYSSETWELHASCKKHVTHWHCLVTSAAERVGNMHRPIHVKACTGHDVAAVGVHPECVNI